MPPPQPSRETGHLSPAISAEGHELIGQQITLCKVTDFVHQNLAFNYNQYDQYDFRDFYWAPRHQGAPANGWDKAKSHFTST